jgi:RND family efflux transporter MFP subunit
MKRTWLLVVMAFILGGAVAGVALWRGPRTDPGAGRAADRVTPARGGAAREPAAVRYHCPMHPTIVSGRPGECPICTMRLVPIDEGASPDAAVPGYVPVTIPARKQQHIGVTTQRIERRVLSQTVNAVGRVDYDETGLSWVNARVGGWIEALHVDRTGQLVRRGQPLLEIYSPDLVGGQEEYLVAMRNVERLEASNAIPTAVSQARALLADARRRLELWDIPVEQIETLEERGTVTRLTTLRSPAGGYVVEKTALQGKHLEPGENLYRIADLSRVWVQAEVYEDQLPLLKPDQEAEIEVSSLPGRPYRGRIDYIYPYLEAATRTVRVRVVVPNPDLSLRPEMYARITFRPESAGPLLTVPNEAILDTGERRIAFVARGEGTFEPRELTIGLRTRDYTVVLDGLAEGEEVVTSGNFLIDSESRLKAALSGMAAGAGGHKHGE